MKKIIFASLFALPFVAFANVGYNYMMPWGWGMMGGGNVFMFLALIIWLVVGILAAIWLWQHINKK